MHDGLDGCGWKQRGTARSAPLVSFRFVSLVDRGGFQKCVDRNHPSMHADDTGSHHAKRKMTCARTRSQRKTRGSTERNLAGNKSTRRDTHTQVRSITKRVTTRSCTDQLPVVFFFFFLGGRRRRSIPCVPHDLDPFVPSPSHAPSRATISTCSHRHARVSFTVLSFLRSSHPSCFGFGAFRGTLHPIRRIPRRKPLPSFVRRGISAIGSTGILVQLISADDVPLFPRARGLLIPDQLEWCNGTSSAVLVEILIFSVLAGRSSGQGRPSAHASMAMAHVEGFCACAREP